MLKLRGCPRCKTGDVEVDRDHYGWYEYCIQCGYMRDLLNIVELGRQTGERTSREVKAETLTEGK